MPTDSTPNLDLPYIMAAQAQKHVTHNEAIRILDALVQLSVLDRDLAIAPAAPSSGDRYIVATGASGGWSGSAGKIAAFQDGAWAYLSPRQGWLAWVADEDRLVAWDGANWVVADSGAVNPAQMVGVNATASAPNRLSVKSDAVLFSHDDVTPGTGDQRTALNKSSAANTASLLFQTGYSGRAEIGLTGDDKLRFKVSTDGAAWSEVFHIDAATGIVRIGAGGNVGIGAASPAAQLEVLETDSTAVRGIANRQVSDDSSAPLLKFFKARGTIAAPGAVLSGDVIGNFSFGGFDGSAGWGATNDSLGVRFRGQTAENWSATAHGANLLFETVPIGSTVVTERMRITSEGNVGVGAVAPTAKLDVAGAVKVGSYTVATLPGASANGAGSLIYVSNETGGAVIAYSDGTNWRRVTDRAVVA